MWNKAYSPMNDAPSTKSDAKPDQGVESYSISKCISKATPASEMAFHVELGLWGLYNLCAVGARRI